MKKAFFNQFEKERVEVTGYKNHEGKTYRFIFQVGYFRFELDGQDDGDNLFIKYPIYTEHPTYRETLCFTPVLLHNDEELAQFVFHLSEISDYQDRIREPDIQEVSFEPFPSTVSDLPQFVEFCRARGALIYEGFQSFHHDKTNPQTDMPHMVFHEDLYGFYFVQNDDAEGEFPENVYPNAEHIVVKEHHIHIHDQFIKVILILTEHENVHNRFPVYVYDNREVLIKKCENTEELAQHANDLFQQAREEAKQKGLSLYSHHLLSRMVVKGFEHEDNQRDFSLNTESKKDEDKEFESIWRDEQYPVFLYKQYRAINWDEEIPF